MKAEKTLLLVLASAFAALAGCWREPYQEQGWATQAITSDYVFPARDESGQVIPEGVTVARADIEKGRRAYMHYCYACHGVNGDGEGPAGQGYRPPPRDFRTASFKFGAVRSGEMPNDDDLMRIVKGGLHGTAMLEWDISDGELRNILHFIKTFPQIWCDPTKLGDAKTEECKAFTDEQITTSLGVVKPSRWLDTYERGKKAGQPKPTGEPVTVPDDPWVGKTDQALERGAAIYHLRDVTMDRGGAQCNSCHPSFWTKQEMFTASLKPGAECAARCDKDDTKCRQDCSSKFPPVTSFREGMYLGIVLEAAKNPYKVNLMPPDFTLHPLRSIRKGQELQDLYRLIAAGVGGVMPAWVDGLKADEIWALTHYTKSLLDLRQPENLDALRQLRDKINNQPPFVPPSAGKETKRVTVSIDAGGEVTIGGQSVGAGGLKDHFAKLMEDAEVEVSIVADKTTSQEKVLAVVDAIKAAGISKVAVSTPDKEGEGEQPPEPPPGGETPAPPEGEPKAPAPAPVPAPVPEAPAPAPEAPAPP